VGSYSDGYEPAPGVVHVRRVLFVKNKGYWVVSDRLYEMNPAKVHEFELQFQFSSPGVRVHSGTKIVESNNEDANLMIIPVMPEGVGIKVFEGQTDPPRGWIGWDYHRDLKTPASQVVYEWQQACPANADVVLVPFPGKTKPVISVKALSEHGADVTALEIQTQEGFQRIFMRHSVPKPAGGAQENAGNEETEVRIIFFNLEGKLESTSGVYAGFLTAEPVSVGQPLAFEWINEHTVKVSWLFGEEGQGINRIYVDYGHAEGGGYIFRKPSEVQTGARGEMSISGLSAGRNYICRAWAEKAGEASGVLLAEGGLKFPSYYTNNSDSDNDGMPDAWEARHGLNPHIDDGMKDSDEDGLTNMAEYRKGTAPNNKRSRPTMAMPWLSLLLNKDSEGDAKSSEWEIRYGLNLGAGDADLDPDGDGLNNLQEFKSNSNPQNKDTDRDGMPDGWEIRYGLNPLFNDAPVDLDSDRFTNLDEYGKGTEPNDPNSRPTLIMPWIQLLLDD
jgi:hypothetical protein